MRNFLKALRNAWIRLFNVPEVGQLRVAKHRMVLDLALKNITIREAVGELFIEPGESFLLLEKTKCFVGFDHFDYDAFYIVRSSGRICRTSRYTISKHSRLAE